MFLFITFLITILASSPIIHGVPIESCSRSICTTLTDCAPYMQLLQSTPRSQKRPLFVYLRSQECGVNSNKRMPMVCCYNSAQNTRKKYMNYNDNKGQGQHRLDYNDRLDSRIDWRRFKKTKEGNSTSAGVESWNDTSRVNEVTTERTSYFIEDEFEDEQMNSVAATKFKYSDVAYDLTRRRRGTVGYGTAMVDVEIR